MATPFPMPAAVPLIFTRALTFLFAIGLSAAFAAPKDDLAARQEFEAVRAETERLVESAQWKEALATGDRLLVAARKQFGPEHAEVIHADLLLGETRQRLGEPVLAEFHFRRALVAQEKILAPTDAALVTTLTRLASALKAQERLSEAEPFLQRALDLQVATRGLRDEDTAVSARNLAVVLKMQGDYGRALPHSELAFAIRQQSSGENADETLESLADLVELHRLRGEMREAEALLTSRLRRLERSIGPGNLEVAAAARDLATFYESAGQLAPAQAAAQQSYEVRAERFGKDDPRAVNALIVSASLAAAAGDAAKAQAAFATHRGVERCASQSRSQSPLGISAPARDRGIARGPAHRGRAALPQVAALARKGVWRKRSGLAPQSRRFVEFPRGKRPAGAGGRFGPRTRPPLGKGLGSGCARDAGRL